MANKTNKVIIDGVVELDLTADTVTAADVANGKTFHLNSGETATGTSTKDLDTSGATAQVAEILSGKTAGLRGAMVTGTMKNNGAVSGTISTKAGAYTIPVGYHDGSGKVQISSTEQAKLTPANIREGVTVLGVVGTLKQGTDEKPQTKSVTPTFDSQQIVPDSGYTCLSSVTVAGIPITRTQNSAGGTTITVG